MRRGIIRRIGRAQSMDQDVLFFLMGSRRHCLCMKLLKKSFLEVGGVKVKV